jgi:hypothetical protein
MWVITDDEFMPFPESFRIPASDGRRDLGAGPASRDSVAPPQAVAMPAIGSRPARAGLYALSV